MPIEGAPEVGIWSVNNPHFGEQYFDTGWFGMLFTLTLVLFLVYNIQRAKGNKNLFVRRISGLTAIDEAVGRATEMGKPVLMVPGLSDPVNANAVQAINICGYVTKAAAKFANPIILCAYSASMYTLAQEVIRDVYQSEGVPERYDTDSVRYISDRQFAFAAGVSGIILREQTAATFFLGEFYAESLIFAETANSVGAIQVASSTEATQTPFFIAACDYVLIGDEFYAASAYLTREPVLVGSLIGQDWSKILAMACMVIGIISQTIFARTHADKVNNAMAASGLNREVLKQKLAAIPVTDKPVDQAELAKTFTDAGGDADKLKEAMKVVKDEEKKIFAFPKLFKTQSPPEDLDMKREKVEEVKEDVAK
jgi:hypothetical protein